MRNNEYEWHEKIFFRLSARLFGESCLELCIFRFTPSGEMQIYLLPRPIKDPFWSGKLHIPGVRKCRNDSDQDQLWRVIAETPFRDEIHSVRYLFSITQQTKRATQFSDIRRAVIDYAGKDKNFYDVNNLPIDKIVDHHIKIIQLASQWTLYK